MVSAPFFNKEAGESAAMRAEKLEIEIETIRKFNADYKQRISKLEVSLAESRADLEKS